MGVIQKDDLAVAGGGGAIGGHLIAELLDKGYSKICSVDVKPVHEWF